MLTTTGSSATEPSATGPSATGPSTTGAPTRAWRPWLIGALIASTVLWVVGTGATLVGWFWAGSNFGGPLSPVQHTSLMHWQLALGLVVGLGPLVLAVLAAVGRHSKTFVAFVLLLLVVALPALLTTSEAWRQLHPPAPTAPGPVHCQENSGGDNRCPGD